MLCFDSVSTSTAIPGGTLSRDSSSAKPARS